MTLAPPSTSAQSPDATLRAILQSQTDAWNRDDAPAWTRDFTADADFINIRGDFVHGRDGITAIHAMIFAGPYKGSHSVVTIDGIRHPTPDTALVRTTHEITNFHGLPPGVGASSPGTLRARLTYLFIQQDGVWKICFAQNSAIAAIPLTPGPPH